MKILDKYIIKKFIQTFLFIIFILTIIVLVIDISENLNRMESNGSNLKEALVEYYPYWIIWLTNTFISIVVFIATIFFTSQLSEKSEIIAMTSGGVSFYRLVKPYFIIASSLFVITLLVNHFALPYANVYKNKYNFDHLQFRSKNQEFLYNRKIAVQISKNEYLFVHSFNRAENTGEGLLYEKFKGQNLVESYKAAEIKWVPKDSIYELIDCYEYYKISNKKDSLAYNLIKRKKIKATPDDILPESYVAETMNTPKLLDFIKKEKEKGSSDIDVYSTVLHKRTSLPFSNFILAILGFSISSERKRGGMGLNLAIGISLAFGFIFANQMISILSDHSVVNPFLGAWIPNFIFGSITLYLFIKRSKV
ncbi:MAG: LptF/LptG family permease [Solirubrobacteraceae bacterium]